MTYILAIDQGTTSSRAIIFDNSAQAVATGQASFKQFYPQSGWVEHDGTEIWESVSHSIKEALSQASLNPEDIDAIGITNQRETVLLWDKKTGEPVAPAIVWQDKRTASYIQSLKKAGHGEEITKRTGLIPDAYFSASKIGWLLDHHEGLRARAEAGDIAFGTIDSWLLYRLSDGARHVTDISNASRTMLCNIVECRWDAWLLELFNIPDAILPEIVDSCGNIGASASSVFGAEVPVTAIAGDQQAATFGHLCLDAGHAKNTYGTGCFLVSPTGQTPPVSHNKLLATVARRHSGQPVEYALEGSVFSAGAAINWAASTLGLGDDGAGLSALAAQVDDSAGVYFVPALAGLGAPHWEPYAQGTWLGITAGTTRAHMARAVLEGVAFQVHDLLRTMEQDLGTSITQLMVDGGVTRSDILMQFQADICNINIIRPKEVEATARGIALMAGLAVGIWSDISALQKLPNSSTTIKPDMDDATRQRLLTGWRRAVSTAAHWANTQEETTIKTKEVA